MSYNAAPNLPFPELEEEEEKKGDMYIDFHLEGSKVYNGCCK